MTVHPVSSSTAAVTADTTRDSDALTPVCTTADSAVFHYHPFSLLPDFTPVTSDLPTTETIPYTLITSLLPFFLPLLYFLFS